MDGQLDDILSLARERFDRAWEFDQVNREDALDDLHFRAGEQWPEEEKRKRREEGRPTLTINRMPQFVKQVTGDIRQNRPSVKVRPVDSGSDPDVAKVFSGIIRHIEQASDAQSAYVTAADSSATCGIGHFRILTEYASDKGFEQRIRIKRIRNPFAVYWDPDAEELTREDAKYCFVSERISMEEFKARYPDASTADFEGSQETEDWLTQWWDGETVRIAEYWVKKPEKKTIALLGDGQVVDFQDGMPVSRTRVVETFKVCCYKLNGVEVLEDVQEFAVGYIPIIPVVGEEVHIGDRIVRHGIVRFAKDPQRMYNYWRTTGVESIALAPKAPWLLTPQMIEGHKGMWEMANKGNPPYLLYNADPQSNRVPQRQQPPTPPAAMWQEAAVAADDMKATTGIYDASLGAQGNETSGRAIMARQQEGDTGSYVYMDNLARAIRYAGKILVAMIPKIYDTQRVVRLLGEDDTEDFVELNVPVQDEAGNVTYATVLTDKQGREIYKPTLDAGEYDVEIVTGPSYATKRIEAADSLLSFAQAVPQAGAVIGDLIARNMDWPGAEQMAERLKKLLPPGIADDDEKLSPEEMQARQAAQQQAQMAQQVALAKAQADIENARASAARDMSSAQKTQAETEGAMLANAQKALELAMQSGQIDQLVAQIVQQQVQQVLMEMSTPAPQGPFTQ